MCEALLSPEPLCEDITGRLLLNCHDLLVAASTLGKPWLIQGYLEGPQATSR